MVGVPGRSKGCHTCRKRRIKCDEQKPKCARCTKAGYRCAGYDRKIEFRITTVVSHAGSGTTTATTSRVPTPTSEIIPEELSLVAFKRDMQYAYLFRNFVWASYGSPWLQLSAHGKLGVLAQQACSAFSMTIFALHHNRRDIELDGDMQYGQAVVKVCSGLVASSGPRLAELLVPVLILLLHSSTTPETGESQAHVMGLFRLLFVCGPGAFQDESVLPAFRSCRATLVTVGLLQKRRAFLEEPSWCNTPWANNPVTKTDQDRLVDLLAQVPGMLETQQGLRNSFDIHRQQQLISRVESQLHYLFQWRRSWEATHQSVVFEVDRHPTLSTSVLPATVRRLLRFSCFSDAVEIALYNAVLLCFLGVLHTEMGAFEVRTLIQEVAAYHDSDSDIWSNLPLSYPPRCSISLQTAAVEIVRSFEYQLTHVQHSPDTPALFWLFPLGLASKVLADDEVMTQWIQKMLDTSAVTRGYGRGKNAFGFGFYELPKVDESDGGYYGQVHIS